MNLPADSDMALTIEPYYQSTYVLLIAKGRGFDDIKDARQLADLPPDRQDAENRHVRPQPRHAMAATTRLAGHGHTLPVDVR